MKKILIVHLMLVACTLTHAQATYMGVTLDRGKEPETNCIYIFNDNADSVRVLIQYKVGNRSTPWIDYHVPQLIPPTIDEPQKIGCVDSTIIGLNLLDVKIIKNNGIILVDEENSDSGNRMNESAIKKVFKKIKSWFSD